jgi:hypothetical protein
MVDVPVTKPEVRLESEMAKIYFDLQKSNINKKELKKAEIDSLKNSIVRTSKDSNKEIKNLKFSSYASPDGPQNLNQKLVDERGKNSKKAFEGLLSKTEIEELKEIDFFLTETTPIEDWEGFQKLVQESTMQDKELVLRVLSMYSDPDTRENETYCLY